MNSIQFNSILIKLFNYYKKIGEPVMKNNEYETPSPGPRAQPQQTKQQPPQRGPAPGGGGGGGGNSIDSTPISGAKVKNHVDLYKNGTKKDSNLKPIFHVLI
jgi:hypothetical protein